MSLPSVSIFIVTYLDSEERCRVLEATCRNALQQRYPNFEVVVSDNAGPISAEEALASISDPRLTIFRNEENLGMAGNMNLCIERCKHEIIKMNCDDDLLHPDFLSVTVPWVDDETLVVTEMEKYIIGTHPEGMDRDVSRDPDIVTREPGYRRDFWRITYDALPGDTLFTKKLHRSLGGYQSGSGVCDWDFAVRARMHKKVLNIREILCFQGVWDSSLTEKILKTKPYYFITSGLFTKFNLLSEGSFSFPQRLHLYGTLFFQLIFAGLRCIRNLHQPAYRSGFKVYWSSLLGSNQAQ
ncbi:glycosyltransferase family 2 protein [Pontiellaceae bacterium B12227]|nr:glycosyltransferase family 2 protein [Pontiellaceae bacterium B12227]